MPKEFMVFVLEWAVQQDEKFLKAAASKAVHDLATKQQKIK